MAGQITPQSIGFRSVDAMCRAIYPNGDGPPQCRQAVGVIDDSKDGIGIGSLLFIGALVAVLWYSTNNVFLVEAYKKGTYRRELKFYGTFFDREEAESQAANLRHDGYDVSLKTFKDSFSH